MSNNQQVDATFYGGMNGYNIFQSLGRLLSRPWGGGNKVGFGGSYLPISFYDVFHQSVLYSGVRREGR
jgi:hypothetical protein